MYTLHANNDTYGHMQALFSSLLDLPFYELLDLDENDLECFFDVMTGLLMLGMGKPRSI
jgi:hypothetical protein